MLVDWSACLRVLQDVYSDLGFIFTDTLKKNGIQISMDGRGRFRDNIFVERLWWTLKYHYLYLNAFANGLKDWFKYYNQERFHQSLEDWTPDEIYYMKQELKKAA